MIPKIIHYCWFGKNEKPANILVCMSTWEKLCPDYEIICWDESNSPMQIKWISDAYRFKKYAFVADYMRFYVLNKFGGIYLDTDMYLLKPLDCFLSNSFFLGLEDSDNIAYGIIGSVKDNYINKVFLDYYEKTRFDFLKPQIVTKLFKNLFFNYGFRNFDKNQLLTNDIMIYSTITFYPIHYTHKFTLNKLINSALNESYAVHLWEKSWKSEFDFFELKEYQKGFRIVFDRIKDTPILPFKYYKKLMKYVIKYFCVVLMKKQINK